jgi:stage V sporulation protein SpoVS
MRTTDLKDLTNTVELLRKKLHPDLDAGFLAAVVRAEEENHEDDAEALRAIQAALRAVLVAKGIV